MIGHETCNNVEVYAYIGQIINANPNNNKKSEREFKWDSAFDNHSKSQWCNKGELPVCLEIKVFNQSTLSLLTYSSETWQLTKYLRENSRSAQRYGGV